MSRGSKIHNLPEVVLVLLHAGATTGSGPHAFRVRMDAFTEVAGLGSCGAVRWQGGSGPLAPASRTGEASGGAPPALDHRDRSQDRRRSARGRSPGGA